ERARRGVCLVGRPRQVALLVDGDEIAELARVHLLRSRMAKAFFARLYFSDGSGKPSVAARTRENSMAETGLPLEGVRVIEMTHMVMGPTCGMILAQLGAEIIKVEPPQGDKTRSLGGMGTSFFPRFNRGKRSVVLDRAKAEYRA